MGRIVTRSANKTHNKDQVLVVGNSDVGSISAAHLTSTKTGKVSKKRKRKRKMVDKDSALANLDDSVLSLSLDDTDLSDHSQHSTSLHSQHSTPLHSQEPTSSKQHQIGTQPADTSQLKEGKGTADSDCSICLQSALHPVKLPCSHIFCYLCIKGVVHSSSGQCALCRAPVPRNFIFNPEVVEEAGEEEEEAEQESYRWYYEGRGGGWWEYDARTSQNIEDKFAGGTERQLELMIAGYIYIVDLDSMVQKRKTAQHIQRRIKRDKNITDKRGVAGIKSNKYAGRGRNQRRN